MAWRLAGQALSQCVFPLGKDDDDVHAAQRSRSGAARGGLVLPALVRAGGNALQTQYDDILAIASHMVMHTRGERQ